MIGPSGGNGVGGTGGGPLGGCLTCACGMPSAIPVRVAAGNGPIALARPLTSSDIFASAAAPAAPNPADKGSAILLVIEAACCAAEFMACAVSFAFFRPAAIACLVFGGGTGSTGAGGGTDGFAGAGVLGSCCARACLPR